ncbi:hypothetical protein PMEGAS70_19310 [Priestia megaterium]
MLTPIAIFIEGKRSIKKANAAKIAISILACKGNALFTFLTPVFESFISNGLHRSKQIYATIPTFLR